jgi:hypothetical protein
MLTTRPPKQQSGHRHVLATYKFGTLKQEGENNVNKDDKF